MIRRLFWALCLLIVSVVCLAEDMKLTAPEMEPRLTYGESASKNTYLLLNQTASDMSKGSESWTWMKTRDNVKPYKFMDDMTFVGVPLFLAGWAIKGDKAMFRVNQKAEQGGKRNTQLLTDFKTGIDDYTQYFGPAMVVGLKLGGVEGRSDWGRLLSSAAMSYGIMALFVNGIKYTAKEMRPDGSTANSWPSGHTATSFVGATLLHKEYGLTRSPWYSVAGYGVATATGVMRVLNNRHWVSDVMSGAGIGILSTELGYALGDLIFKQRGLLRNDLVMDSENPSFFSISMGVGLGGKNLDFSSNDLVDKERFSAEDLEEEETKERIQFRSATVVDAEGAYFFNKYIGVGGRFRVRAMSAKTFGEYAENSSVEDIKAWAEMSDVYRATHPEDFPENPSDPEDQEITNLFQYYKTVGFTYADEEAFSRNAPVTDIKGIVKSDHMAEFTGSIGVYFNLPLSKRFSLGSKALIGRSITQDLDIDGHAEGNVKDINYELTISNGEFVSAEIDYPNNTADNEKYVDDWDYLTLSATNSTSWGTGLSLTYRFKSNFSWRLFMDYDYTNKSYTLKYDPYHFLRKGLTDNAYRLMSLASEISASLDPIEFRMDKKMHFFTAGLSFLVNF